MKSILFGHLRKTLRARLRRTSTSTSPPHVHVHVSPPPLPRRAAAALHTIGCNAADPSSSYTLILPFPTARDTTLSLSISHRSRNTQHPMGPSIAMTTTNQDIDCTAAVPSSSVVPQRTGGRVPDIKVR